MKKLTRSQSALLEIVILFLPAVPALLWVWPHLNSRQNDILQTVTNIYVLAGALYIGLRRWSWDQLGVNRKGMWLALGCGGALLAGRLLIILSVDWEVRLASFTPLSLAVNLINYFILISLVQELMFRGLIYRALDEWRGAGLAIWGSSFAFGLWHIGQGPLFGLLTMILGLFFALMRWRGGGIVGLIVLHALWDLENVFPVFDVNLALQNPGSLGFRYPVGIWLGTALLVLTPVYLLWVHPRLFRHQERLSCKPNTSIPI